MQILSWILSYKFRLDSGDLGGWLIGAVRSFHTAEYGRAVQGAVVGESSTTDEGCKAIVSHTSPNSQGIPNLRWLSKVSRSLRQSRKNLGSRVALLPGKFLRVRKVFARITEKTF